MPGITSEVLGLILGTISPWSVGSYLGFALGRGIGGYRGEEWEDWSEKGVVGVGAKGLEKLGKPIRVNEEDAHRPGESSTGGDHKEGDKGPTSRIGRPHRASSPTFSVQSSVASSQISGLREDGADDGSDLDGHGEEDSYFYGLPSSKIGEGCACWLSRWGVDVLDVEAEIWKARGKGTTKGEDELVRKLKEMDIGERDRVEGEFPIYDDSVDHPPRPFPPIWSLGGLPASWIRAVISSDAFFVSSEMERYQVAKKVFEMRRAQRQGLKKGWEVERRRSEEEVGEDVDWRADEEEDAEEGEFESLFEGIFYTHMVRFFSCYPFQTRIFSHPLCFMLIVIRGTLLHIFRYLPLYPTSLCAFVRSPNVSVGAPRTQIKDPRLGFRPGRNRAGT